jgi:hypothetical protein
LARFGDAFLAEGQKVFRPFLGASDIWLRARGWWVGEKERETLLRL